MTERRTFVMGDLHGACKALRQCLERSDFDLENDILIQLGDVTDGYPEVYECVEALLEVRHLIALRGNHDDWFLDFLKTGIHPGFWKHGGKGTIASYLSHSDKKSRSVSAGNGFKPALKPQDIPRTHKVFFERQQLYHIDVARRCYVHAGFNRHLPFDKQKREDFYWDRELWAGAIRATEAGPEDFFTAVNFKEIYLGHTPTLNWQTDKPMQALNVYNLDTGAGHSGRLTIMNTATKDYWQSDPLPQLYRENPR